MPASSIPTKVLPDGHAPSSNDIATALIATPRNDAAPRERPAPTDQRFRVLKSHARGGLGEIYLAVDTRLGREVAIKQIQDRFALDTDARNRFIREAEVTGMLEHPGVVPVYDLGQRNDGHLFYAMRLIRGETLLKAIESYHGGKAVGRSTDRRLAFRELIERLVDVCQAIGYAHSRGIIHRDLKPSNIMLGPYGETLVVDWGLARRFGSGPTNEDVPSPVTERRTTGIPSGDTSTRAGDTLGTPAYMSPEQAGGRIDELGPASDVYSLGATLLHALTGHVPTPAAPPPVADWRIPRGLAAVVRKAMALRAADRYQAADLMADDLQRWLADEPVTAERESWIRRAARWCRRHRTLMTTGTSLLVVAVAGLSLGLVAVNQAREYTEQARKEAADQRDEARRQRQRTRDALDSMTTGIASQSLNEQNRITSVQKEFLGRMLEYYREFAQESADSVDDLVRVAKAQFRVAQMNQEMGRNAEALVAARACVATYESCVGRGDDPAAIENLRAEANLYLGCVQLHHGLWAEAEPQLRKTIAMCAGPSATREHDAMRRKNKAHCLAKLAELYKQTGKAADALTAAEEAVAIRTGLVEEKPDSFDARRDLTNATLHRAEALTRLGRLAEALAQHERVIELSLEAVRTHGWDFNVRFDLCTAYTTYAHVYWRMGKHAEAAKSYRRALVIVDELATTCPGMAQYRASRLHTLSNLSTCLSHDPSKLDEALVLAREAVVVGRKLVADQPDHGPTRQTFILALMGLANRSRRSGEFNDAIEINQEAIRNMEVLRAAGPVSSEAECTEAGVSCNLSIELSAVGRFREALASADRAVEILERLMRSPHPPGDTQRYLRNSYNHRSTARDCLGDSAGALADANAGLRIPSSLDDDLQEARALYLAHLGRHAEATALADDLSRAKPVRVSAAVILSRVYARAGQPYFDRAFEMLTWIERGGLRPASFLNQPDLDNLRNDPRFKAIRDEWSAQPANDQ
ncbi:MAG: tetratricopeptide repeat protein [Gemmataceae bacterium]|nr:tetratricopeptide repeat protein [Gemmataceae bacterium]